MAKKGKYVTAAQFNALTSDKDTVVVDMRNHYEQEVGHVENAIEIATEGGKLYDKFASLVEDLKKLGNQLDTVQKTYQEANKKLHSGSGNLIGKVERLRLLGAKNTRNIAEQSIKQMELLIDNISEE